MTVRARKRLGQHFLHDPAVVAKIVAAIAPQRGDTMVEIGGGAGALTRPLLERLDRLHVVEVDERLAALLEETVPDRERLVVHRADALRFDFASLAAGPRSLRVVGNLPYNVSTPLLFRLLEQREWIQDMHLMLQREVVDRLTAAPGGKEYGRLTVMFGLWAESRACFDIGPGAFSPPPRVWSTLVCIRPRAAPAVPVADERRFAELVARLFSMRRKTIGRALKGVLSPEQIASVGVDPMARPETLAPADFARLADLLA
ncbi:MAG TPA: 16S rRNA (adenine(1518)-N(6)/adenine(1519)-N(6))-dimethyltransferase RsmA [Gammaproteobacteria bacterium]